MGTHMPNESHSVTCHPAEVTFTILVFTPAKLALDLATPECRASWATTTSPPVRTSQAEFT